MIIDRKIMNAILLYYRTQIGGVFSLLIGKAIAIIFYPKDYDHSLIISLEIWIKFIRHLLNFIALCFTSHSFQQ